MQNYYEYDTSFTGLLLLLYPDCHDISRVFYFLLLTRFLGRAREKEVAPAEKE
jgi:hypothetical protein